MSLTTPLEPGNRIQLPTDWVAELGVRDKVVLEKTPEGIIVRPAPLTWDEIFAEKLPVGKPQINPDDWQGNTDDLLF
jgi:hypothetical protein